MKFRLTVLIVFSLCLSNVFADEGMWLLGNLRKNKQTDRVMKELGLQMPVNKIYNPKKPSLSDAVVSFGGFCSGVVVSEDGLVFTNHHCGFSAIQSHSSVEHDYLQDGFWAYKMEDELTNLPEGIEKTVFLMHVKPYEFIFNNNVARVFQEYVKQFPNVQFCLYGHEHQLTVDDLFGDGILYYQCPNIGKRTYLVFTIKEGTHEYDYEAVEF